jgi:hypothetical protein
MDTRRAFKVRDSVLRVAKGNLRTERQKHDAIIANVNISVVDTNEKAVELRAFEETLEQRSSKVDLAEKAFQDKEKEMEAK